VLVFHLEVTGSIPAASISFLLDKQSLLFFHPLEPIISKSKKLWDVQEQRKKSGTHNICVPGIMGTHNFLQLFFHGKH
jgi:hypothetical protein